MSDSDDETPTDHQLKFVLLGDGASGKVSFLEKPLKPPGLSCCVENRPSINFACSNRGTYSFFRHRYV